MVCRFMRFPGGCYVEGGDWLKDRFQWKASLGTAVNRPGHFNEIWGYWSSDGLYDTSHPPPLPPVDACWVHGHSFESHAFRVANY